MYFRMPGRYYIFKVKLPSINGDWCWHQYLLISLRTRSCKHTYTHISYLYKDSAGRKIRWKTNETRKVSGWEREKERDVSGALKNPTDKSSLTVESYPRAGPDGLRSSEFSLLFSSPFWFPLSSVLFFLSFARLYFSFFFTFARTFPGVSSY